MVNGVYVHFARCGVVSYERPVVKNGFVYVVIGLVAADGVAVDFANDCAVCGVAGWVGDDELLADSRWVPGGVVFAVVDGPVEPACGVVAYF